MDQRVHEDHRVKVARRMLPVVHEGEVIPRGVSRSAPGRRIGRAWFVRWGPLIIHWLPWGPPLYVILGQWVFAAHRWR